MFGWHCPQKQPVTSVHSNKKVQDPNLMSIIRIDCYTFLAELHHFWLLLPLQLNPKATDLELYMLQQFEGLSVEAHILQHLRVVHVVGELSWWREVTEGHDLFRAVDDHRLIDVGTSRLGLLLEKGNIKTVLFIALCYCVCNKVSQLINDNTGATVWIVLHISWVLL